jgi:hypothetical protein
MSRAWEGVLERQAPGHVTTLMQDTLSNIISLQFKKCSVLMINEHIQQLIR